MTLKTLGLAAAATLAAALPPLSLAAAAAPAQAQAAAPSLKLFPESRLVTADRISVEVVGQGPDVVLIPGLASSRETWRRTAERLKGRYRLHLVQVAGFAGEPARANASGPVTAPTVEAIDAYIVSARLKRPAVVGHSLGGVMAAELALDHPDHVSKVMIVDSLAFYTELFAGPAATAEAAKPYADRMGAQLLAGSDAAFAQGAAQTAAAMATAPEDQARITAWTVASDRAVMVKAMQEDMTTDLRPRVGSFKVPVTIFYEAALEGLIKADYAAAPQKTLTPAAAGAKHFLMYDDPKTFDATLDAFLAK
jgi:pimeloyl-ACP methyl ester carboxylesterase